MRSSGLIQMRQFFNFRLTGFKSHSIEMIGFIGFIHWFVVRLKSV